jgi:hypothetical protein
MRVSSANICVSSLVWPVCFVRLFCLICRHIRLCVDIYSAGLVAGLLPPRVMPWLVSLAGQVPSFTRQYARLQFAGFGRRRLCGRLGAPGPKSLRCVLRDLLALTTYFPRWEKAPCYSARSNRRSRDFALQLLRSKFRSSTAADQHWTDQAMAIYLARRNGRQLAI